MIIQGHDLKAQNDLPYDLRVKKVSQAESKCIVYLNTNIISIL